MRAYLRFLWRCFRISFAGDWRYHAWMLALTVLSLLGLNAWCRQLADGLATTGMTDQVSWGLYIANFTFLVGIAAAAVMLVIPSYIYRRHELHVHRVARLRALNAPLDLAHVREILVEPCAVRWADRALQRARFVGHGVEDAAVLVHAP